MRIDGSPLEKEALEHLRQGDKQRFFECQDRFLVEIQQSGEDHCSCKAPCKYHGKCLDCVLIHRGHQDHLPVCFHGMVNQRLQAVTSLSETHLTDGKGKPVS